MRNEPSVLLSVDRAVSQYREAWQFSETLDAVEFAAKKNGNGRNCKKGYPCGMSCISKKRTCRNKLSGQAGSYQQWLTMNGKAAPSKPPSKKSKPAQDSTPPLAASTNSENPTGLAAKGGRDWSASDSRPSATDILSEVANAEYRLGIKHDDPLDQGTTLGNSGKISTRLTSAQQHILLGEIVAATGPGTILTNNNNQKMRDMSKAIRSQLGSSDPLEQAEALSIGGGLAKLDNEQLHLLLAQVTGQLLSNLNVTQFG